MCQVHAKPCIKYTQSPGPTLNVGEPSFGETDARPEMMSTRSDAYSPSYSMCASSFVFHTGQSLARRFNGGGTQADGICWYRSRIDMAGVAKSTPKYLHDLLIYSSTQSFPFLSTVLS